MADTRDLSYRGSAPRWTPRRLAEMRTAMDPPVDLVVEEFRKAHPELDEPRDLVVAVIRELARSKGLGAPPTAAVAIAGLFVPPPLPSWGCDAKRVRAGQQVFKDHGVAFATTLFFASLPIAYATPEGAEVLLRTSDLATSNLTRRIAETGQMLLDVMGVREDDPFKPGRRAYSTSIGVRVLHSCVRVLLTDPKTPPWPKDCDPPLNQRIMMATLLDFTLVPWEALERLGIVLEDDDREAYAHVWSIVGFLMGVDACQDGPLGLSDLETLQREATTMLGASEAGSTLMRGFMAEMEGFMPLGWRKLPRSLVRWLFEGAPGEVGKVPDHLGVRPAAWWSRPLFATLRSTRRSAVLAPIRAATRVLTGHAGRLVLIGFADRFSDGAAPFAIPPELAASWRIRTGAAAKATRGARRSVRTQVRRVPVPQAFK